MKVLILGITGMLGHKLYQQLVTTFDVIGTLRGGYNSISRYGFFQESDIIPNINALRISQIEEVIGRINPNVVINSIGIIKSVREAQDRLLNIWVNSLFPHQLYQICKRKEIRLIHISTDCVFSGKKGNYRETDPSDAEDIYGKTKYLGEVSEERALTIRTSLIGRELSTANNLVEWFLSNQGSKVNGFTNAIFSGFPTIRFAQIMANIIAKEQNLSGVYHISSKPISKFKLLTLIRERMNLDIEVEEYTDFCCDRSLDSTLYRDKTGFEPASWGEMIDEFAQDAQQYQQWRAK
ncbi:MAG TPA: SDR family oxidoreductase [Dehalococcoidia bacterium]|nr:SDR family oxidoreductase [Dehalococcoidia bacterium]